MPAKILVVDDDRLSLKVIEAFLQQDGLETVALLDSLEAAKELEKQKFDAILVDANMPNLDGFKLAERVRASRLNASVPVAMITAYDDAATRKRADAVGITMFVGKPVTLERVLPIVHTMVGRRHQPSAQGD